MRQCHRKPWKQSWAATPIDQSRAREKYWGCRLRAMGLQTHFKVLETLNSKRKERIPISLQVNSCTKLSLSVKKLMWLHRTSNFQSSLRPLFFFSARHKCFCELSERNRNNVVLTIAHPVQKTCVKICYEMYVCANIEFRSFWRMFVAICFVKYKVEDTNKCKKKKKKREKKEKR